MQCLSLLSLAMALFNHWTGFRARQRQGGLARARIHKLLGNENLKKACAGRARYCRRLAELKAFGVPIAQARVLARRRDE